MWCSVPEGYREYCGVILSNVGGYHDAPGVIISTVGVFSTVEEKSFVI